MNEIKSPTAIAALMSYRDLLNRQANDILQPAQDTLNKAKADYHDALMASRKLRKQAEAVQRCISPDMLEIANEISEMQDHYPNGTPETLVDRIMKEQDK